MPPSRFPIPSWRVLPLAVVVAACGDSTTEPEPRPEITALTVTEAVPLVRRLSVELSRPAAVDVVYGADDGEVLTTSAEGPSRGHTLPLVRLRAGRTYRVAGVAREPNGATSDTVRASFTTAPLPQALSALEFPTSGSPTHPLTLLEVSGAADGWGGAVVVDGRGRVVWYREMGGVGGSTRRADGSLAFLAGGGIQVVSATGDLVALLPEAPPYPRIHHDVRPTQGNTLMFLAQDPRTLGEDTIRGEAVWEWDPATGATERRWSAWDHLSWEDDQGWNSRPSDWLHANSLWLGARGNLIVSFPWLDQIVSIAPDGSALEWRLGGPNADIEPEVDAAFHFQHSATEVPAGPDGHPRILLFDNGFRERGYSRALELRLDIERGVAEKVWEFVPPNGNFSQIVSLARRLDNGNTFVTFGAQEGVAGSTGPVEVYEVAPDGRVVWNLRVEGAGVSGRLVVYRATPLDDLAGERAVEPG